MIQIMLSSYTGIEPKPGHRQLNKPDIHRVQSETSRSMFKVGRGSVGLFVKCLYEALESHYKTYNT